MNFLLQCKVDYCNIYNLFAEGKGVAKDPPLTTPSTSNADLDNHGSKYSKLGNEEKEKSKKKIVYILDRFGVSNEAYHEFTQLEGHESMIRSYIVEECQGKIRQGQQNSRTLPRSRDAFSRVAEKRDL